MTGEIQQKKREIFEVFEEYRKAIENADNNREMVRGTRTTAHQALATGSAGRAGGAYVLLGSLEGRQLDLDNEERRLGKRFDDLSDELAKMQAAVRASGKP